MELANKLIFAFTLLLKIIEVSGQQTPDTSFLKLKSNLEIGITPRFAGIIDYKDSPTDSAFYYKTTWLRIQAGYQFLKSQYLHIVVDYYRVRTDLLGYQSQINSTGFGIQYSLKLENALVSLKPFRLYKKPISIRWYPELSMNYGKINLLNTTFRLRGLHQSSKYYGYFQYGIAINFYLNRWSNLSLMYIQEYFPYIKHDPYRYSPLQLKFVIKI
jgi:hypothetical protein